MSTYGESLYLAQQGKARTQVVIMSKLVLMLSAMTSTEAVLSCKLLTRSSGSLGANVMDKPLVLCSFELQLMKINISHDQIMPTTSRSLNHDISCATHTLQKKNQFFFWLPLSPLGKGRDIYKPRLATSKLSGHAPSQLLGDIFNRISIVFLSMLELVHLRLNHHEARFHPH